MSTAFAMSPARAEGPAHPTNTSTTFARLYNFCSNANCTDGEGPGSLVQGLDGNFYGVTGSGGIANSICVGSCGTIYKITPAGTLTTLYSFCSLANCSDGGRPGAFTLGNDGNFYGVTTVGGAANTDDCMQGCGTLFRITPQGALTTLYNFDALDGYIPTQVFWGGNETLYGSTYGDLFQQGRGDVFARDAAGKISFSPMDNAVSVARLQGSNGSIYGTSTPTCDQYCTVQGGSVFTMSSDETFATLYDFCPAESNCTYFSPQSLTQAIDGSLYGVVGGGVMNNMCVTIGYNSCGVIYQLTPEGAFTPIYNFCSLAKCADGEGPYGLLIGSDGNIYGEAGPNAGMIFQLTPGGTRSTVYSFCTLKGCGEDPVGLVQATDGNFYGTTYTGGSKGEGTFYRLTTGLPAFVHPLVTFGAVGSKVRILGSNLKGTTAVSFNGTPATFEVGSNTSLTATVPAGATTGVITVTAPKGLLTSNVAFGVQ